MGLYRNIACFAVTLLSLTTLVADSGSSVTDKHCKTCKPPIPITHVPCKIVKPGKYCVDTNLCYKGCEVAIEVRASNVSINFNNHSLTLKNPKATAIHAKDIFELTIENDKLSFDEPLDNVSGSLIHLEHVNKATLDNLYLHNAAVGVKLEHCSDIHIVRSQIRDCNRANIFARPADGIVVDNCNFYNDTVDQLAVAGLYFDEVENCRITDSQFCNSDIFARKVKGFIVDRVESVVKDSNYIYAMCQLGAADTEIPARECIIKNSTFISHPANEQASCVLLSHAEGVLVDGCTARNDASMSSIFAIGGESGANTKNVKIVNSIFAGPAAFNIGIEAPEGVVHSGIEISNCVLEEAYMANLVFQGPGMMIGCAVKNNTIQTGAGDGIMAEENTLQGCSFLGNLIANNCNRAIYLSSGCVDNMVADNKVFRNGDDIINDGSHNLLDDNTEFNNDLECVPSSTAKKHDPSKRIHGAKGKAS